MGEFEKIRRRFGQMRQVFETADRGYPLSRGELRGLVAKLFKVIDDILREVDKMQALAAASQARPNGGQADKEELPI